MKQATLVIITNLIKYICHWQVNFSEMTIMCFWCVIVIISNNERNVQEIIMIWLNLYEKRRNVWKKIINLMVKCDYKNDKNLDLKVQNLI